MTEKERQVIKKIPLRELVKVTRALVRATSAKKGPFASLKKFVKCPDCKGEFGVRELRRHRAEARRMGRCPRKETKVA